MSCLPVALALAAVTGAALWAAVATANATIVYVVHGVSWRRPLRVGITDADAWDGYRYCAAHHRCRRHRLCQYLTGRDTGSRSTEWAHEVDWTARPRRWPALRRRHAVLYLTFPWRPLALAVERALIRHYRPTRNTAHIPPDELARRRRSRTA